ncbi:hypothetical protein Krac_5213 [Ktedonobacter racemifer DSM 44963]|uniref:Uncharacterized protein n=1 Tax=Ktedonobacter racemifer DSM 44963 TaxID=485913 RepID=D6TV91_KTERA|nr:hypothetical protein Krac_5213 [Ktedonobacter racemifer DSM 44963]
MLFWQLYRYKMLLFGEINFFLKGECTQDFSPLRGSLGQRSAAGAENTSSREKLSSYMKGCFYGSRI